MSSIYVRTSKLSIETHSFKGFYDHFEPPHRKFFEHLPTIPPQKPTMLEQSAQIIENMENSADAAYAAAYPQRLRQTHGAVAPDSPLGKPELRSRPEQGSHGAVEDQRGTILTVEG